MTAISCVNDFRLRLGTRELVPIVIGGMGVDISSAELALEAARLGGIGHISDAMVPTVSDRRFRTHFVKEKARLYKYNVANSDKSAVHFDLEQDGLDVQLLRMDELPDGFSFELHGVIRSGSFNGQMFRGAYSVESRSGSLAIEN